jgi:hypothetical protein
MGGADGWGREVLEMTGSGGVLVMTGAMGRLESRRNGDHCVWWIKHRLMWTKIGVDVVMKVGVACWINNMHVSLVYSWWGSVRKDMLMKDDIT